RAVAGGDEHPVDEVVDPVAEQVQRDERMTSRLAPGRWLVIVELEEFFEEEEPEEACQEGPPGLESRAQLVDGLGQQVEHRTAQQSADGKAYQVGDRPLHLAPFPGGV